MIEREKKGLGKRMKETAWMWAPIIIIVAIFMLVATLLYGAQNNTNQTIKQAILTRNITKLELVGCSPVDVTDNDIAVLCGTVYDYNITSNSLKMLGSS